MLTASAIAMAAVLAGGSAKAEDDVTAWRLFVSDHAAPVVNVIDALDGDKLASFKVKGPASLYRSESGETVYAVQGADGTVSAISSGVSFHDHGDHADIDIDDAKLLDVSLTGTKPAHFVERQGNIAQWFDGEDQARFFTEKAVEDGKLDVKTASVGAAHHG
ncbi:hypothetical protein, partial [Pseudomonas orientalis]